MTEIIDDKHITNNVDRMRWALETITTFTCMTNGEKFRLLPPEEQQDSVGELIGMLGHLCRAYNLNFLQAITEGQAHFEQEEAEEPPIPEP